MTNHFYDARGRLIRSQQGSRAWRYSYDDSGRVASVTDTLDRVTQFDYDSADRLVRQVLPDTQEVRFGYEPRGNVAGVQPPGRPQHGFGYTPVELVSEYAPPDLGAGDEATRYFYDDDRRLTRIERPDGVEVMLDYDPSSGRLEQVTMPRGTVRVHYRGAQVDSIVGPEGVGLAYAYDGPLVTSEGWSGPVAGSVAVGYDSLFQVASQSVSGGYTEAFEYDKDGLLKAAGALSITRADSAGAITGTALGSVTTAQGYNGYGELASVSASYLGAPLYQANYGRDSLGRITSLTETVAGDSTVMNGYEYDRRGRLFEVRRNGALMRRYRYDGNGNRTAVEAWPAGDTASADYDEQDRLERHGNTRYEYTAAGELERAISGADTTNYTYDPLGNLLEVRIESGALVDTLRYLVDGRNRRVARIANRDTTRRWLYQDQLEPVAEVDSAGGVRARYVYGTRAHVPDYVVKGDTTYRIIADHLGSARLVVRVADGAVVQRIDYDAWGRVTLDTNPGFQSFGYAGGLWDASTGLVRFGARDYDPSVGRWTRKDPEGFEAGDANLYAYCGNAPQQYFDPAGLTMYVAYSPGPRSSSGASGAGHLGIGPSPTRTYGHYPDPALTPTQKAPLAVGGSVPGRVLRDDPEAVIAFLALELTPEQERLVLEAIKRRHRLGRQGRLPYRLIGSHCGDFVHDVLAEAGVEIDDSWIPAEAWPRMLNQLKRSP